MDTSRSSTTTRNPCRMAHTAEQFVNVRRTPRSDVGEGELVEAERLERAGAAEERGWAWSAREHSWATSSWSTGRSWSRQATRVLWKTARSGWTRGARRSATLPLPVAPDPTAGPRPRERGRESRRGGRAHRRIEGGDGKEE
jgi:hypothetical protein